MPRQNSDSLDDEMTGGDTTGVKQGDVSLGEQSTFGNEDSSVGDLDGVGGGLDDLGQVTDLTERYEIQEELGRGGMGVVQKAFDRRLKRTVAIKRLKGDISTNRRALQRFLVEAQAVASLNHFHIVQIYDFGRDPEGPFLILEFVPGRSLSDRLKDGPIPLEQAVELTGQLCEALAMAHRHGIIHRDIKPANVLLTANDEVKLTDFGLAKQDDRSTSMHTQTGVVLGTVDFMPPEQRRGATEVDARSDLWSVGATLYQMLTGRSPRVIRLDAVPESLRDIVGQSLEEDPAKRFQTAVEFQKSLRQATKAGSTENNRSSGNLQDGQCPSCNTKNDLTVNFCRGCGTSLAVTCLSCQKPLSVWTKHCTQCGGNQPELLDQRLCELESVREQAEALQRDFQYEQAITLVQTTAAKADSRLADALAWVEEFVAHVQRESNQQIARRDEMVAEAQQFVQEYRYADAVRVLSSIPSGIQNKTVTDLAEHANACETERKSLHGEIQLRIRSRQLDNLLPMVRRYMELKPDSTSTASLRLKLEDREAKAESRRDVILSRANKQWCKQDDAGVLKLLNQIPAAHWTEAAESLRQKSEARLTEVAALKTQLTNSIPNHQTLAAASRYLEVFPRDSAVIALKDRVTRSIRHRRIFRIAISILGVLCAFLVIDMMWLSSIERLWRAVAIRQGGPNFGPPVPTFPIGLPVGFEDAQSRKSAKASTAAPQQSEAATNESNATPKANVLDQEFTNSIGMKFKLIPAGEFLMGSPEQDTDRHQDEGPMHSVRITNPYYLGVMEVAQGQWLAVMQTKPWEGQLGVKLGADYPATQVSWDDAIEYCMKLSEFEGRSYRLPTEAEWEYACRGGKSTAYSFGSDTNGLKHVCWFALNAAGRAQTVGEKQPNAFGLHDMHGNVYEWCSDRYGKYSSSAIVDPAGPSTGPHRVLRGGGWDSSLRDCRSAYRRRDDPSVRSSLLGFRLVLDPGEARSKPPSSGAIAKTNKPVQSKPPSSGAIAKTNKPVQSIATLDAMQQIGNAFHGFHDLQNHFPPAAGDGDRRKSGLSWRVHLLPFLGQSDAYNQFNFGEPWDSPQNLALVDKMPNVFSVDGIDKPGYTSIHVFVGDGTPFDNTSGKSISAFTDGTANTILAVACGIETADIWTKPGGLEFVADNPRKALGTLSKTFVVVMADGNAVELDSSIDDERLRRLIQIKDGQPVNVDDIRVLPVLP